MKKIDTLHNNFFENIQILLKKFNLIFNVKTLIDLKQNQINISG
jgi:hypothetical protein